MAVIKIMLSVPRTEGGFSRRGGKTVTFHLHPLLQGLAFRKGTHELFSCSYDRTVKIWNLDEMAYVETL